MGGGDLNLKKSWHPSTLRNIERVWKAEQKHEAEKQKIEQLQKELAAERAREEIQSFAEDQGVVRKKEEKLDWMYQGPSAMLNRDEYLLGKKIDKTFENLQQIESGKAPEDENNDVGSSMFSSQNLSGTATVDLANKIREDPLFNIMKKEKEQKKNLLNNPVKMKQLQQMLQASLKEKGSKKSKKSKKKKHQHSGDSDEEEIREKRKKHKKQRSSDSDSEQETPRESRNLPKTKNHEYLPDHRSSKYNDQEGYRQHSSGASYERRESNRSSYNNSSQSRSYSSSYHKHSSSYHKDDDSYDNRSKSRNEYSNSHHNRDSESYEREHYVQKNSGNQSSRSNHRASGSSVPKKKLDEKERDRLLKEMQDNAKWREDQRKRNTSRYKEEAERENNIQHIDSTDFMKPMLAKVAHKGTVESRVKQKIFTIQRSSAAMDKHFARRE